MLYGPADVLLAWTVIKENYFIHIPAHIPAIIFKM